MNAVHGNCGIITPLTEYLFYDESKDGSLNGRQIKMKRLYQEFRKTELSNTIYGKCKKNMKFLDQFLNMAWYLHNDRNYLFMEFKVLR